MGENTSKARWLLFCHTGTPLLQQPSAANAYYNPLYVYTLRFLLPVFYIVALRYSLLWNDFFSYYLYFCGLNIYKWVRGSNFWGGSYFFHYVFWSSIYLSMEIFVSSGCMILFQARLGGMLFFNMCAQNKFDAQPMSKSPVPHRY